MKPRLSLPADFIKVAPGQKIMDLAARYDVSRETIRRWQRENGIKVERFIPPAQERQSMPSGFHLAAQTMTVKQLRERYGKGKPTIQRWLREIGGKRRVEVGPRKRFVPGLRPIKVHSPERDMSLAARAADECLCRLAPTYRCTQNGHADVHGAYWRHGNAIVTPEGLVERAKRKGWSPDAWRQVA